MLWCLESQSRVREKHNPSNRAVGWSACARKLFFSYESVKARPHMRLTDMIAKAYVISTWSKDVAVHKDNLPIHDDSQFMANLHATSRDLWQLAEKEDAL